MELYVEVFVDDGMQYEIEMWRYAAEIKQISRNPRIGHEHHPEASARLMRVDVAINSDGLRDRELSPDRTPGEFRIMMLGDSLTFGYGILVEKTYSKRLEAKLRNAGHAVEVINSGMGNYNTSMEVEYFIACGAKYHPDIVLLNYFINDAELMPKYETNAFHETPGIISSADNLLEISMRNARWSVRLISYFIIMFITVGTLEMSLRVFFAFWTGPSVLFYGTPWGRRDISPEAEARREERRRTYNIYFHENVIGKYSKYFAHQIRYGRDENDDPFTVTINSQGFRGKEFNEKKEGDVIRVVTLGASSTFGFGNRDDDTYPYYLEKFLNDKCWRRFEVINLGIPHLNSEQIYALFMAEALALNPDVVTFYEGMNDTVTSRPHAVKSSPQVYDFTSLVDTIRTTAWQGIRWLVNWVREHSVLATFVAELRTTGTGWFARNDKFSEQVLQANIKLSTEHFLTNLARLQQESQRRDILFIVASQQAKSYLVKKEEIRGITYNREAEMVRAKLRETRKLTENELFFLTHTALMDAERNWALKNRVPFVDVIGALDHDRDVIMSWVHLTPKGNRMIATALGNEILNRTCH